MATTRVERFTCDARTRKLLSALEGTGMWCIERAQQQATFGCREHAAEGHFSAAAVGPAAHRQVDPRPG